MRTFLLALAYTAAALITGEPIVTDPLTPAEMERSIYTTSTGGLKP